MGQRRLARAVAGVGGDTALAIVGNVRAMERAIALAAAPREVALDDLLSVHRKLLHGTRDERLGGVVRTEQNWVGGSAFGPAGAEFIPRPSTRPPASALLGRVRLSPHERHRAPSRSASQLQPASPRLAQSTHRAPSCIASSESRSESSRSGVEQRRQTVFSKNTSAP
jgi:hypothetical protein